jgi:hypothetical protein
VRESGSDTIPAIPHCGQLQYCEETAFMYARANSTPVHRLALTAICVAVVAGVLSLYGSLFAEKHLAGSPLNVARNEPGLPQTRDSNVNRYTLEIIAFVLPLILGVGAALLGGEAMKAIEASNGIRGGYRFAVFAIMIGGLAAVVAGCMTIAVFLWPAVPTLYTI